MKKIAAMVLAMLLMFSVCSTMFVSAAEEQPMDEAEVRAKYIEYLGYDSDNLHVNIKGVINEYTIFHASMGSNPVEFTKVYDNYIFMAFYSPDPLGIYAIKEDSIYTLDEVYEKRLADIEAIAKISGGYLLGDGDGDWSLTIKDATVMQKILAGYENISPMQKSYIWRFALDYNQDYYFDINDVTTLQKQLAQIVE